MTSCHGGTGARPLEGSTIKIALVGNCNVGKSVIFNQLTGLNQVVGNWPGKTITWAEGGATFKGTRMTLVDLPGIYSFSTYSLEEVVSREYLVDRRPDVIVNVLDASNLERNLFLTIQLLILDAAPVIVVANQVDLARRKGFILDAGKLAKRLGCPVIETIAVHGKGTHEILEAVVAEVAKPVRNSPSRVKFGKEVEARIEQLAAVAGTACSRFSPKFLALKLLEGDAEIKKVVAPVMPAAVDMAAKMATELEEIHGENIEEILAAEMYGIIHRLVGDVQTIDHAAEKRKPSERLDHFTTHSKWGYVILLLVLASMYATVFTLGGLIADGVDWIFEELTIAVHGTWGEENVIVSIVWDGGVASLFGAVGGVLPLVFIFYFCLEILQDSGYLPRVAFLMDSAMHRIGLHGKSIIPVIIGLGCNVPGCTACKILETEREKNASIFITTLVPCAAVTTVVMGLVGRYMGFGYAVLLYAINFGIIALLGRITYKLSKGEDTHLIIEMHDYRKPNFNVILKQTWFRGKEFVYMALPLIVGIGIAMEIMLMLDVLEPVNAFMAPVTVAWLGLPVGVGIFLIYGILRKELTLVLLVTFAANMGLQVMEFLTPVQMMVFAIVTMLYVPCLATVVVVGRAAGWKKAAIIAIAEIGIALLVGGAMNGIGMLIAA